MIQKSAANPNVHENVKKKKRRKNNKGLLTSMTSHVKDPKQPQYDEQEEGPEDGVDPDDEGLAEIEEQADGNTLGSPGKPRRDSAMSVGTEGGAEKRDQPGGGDLRHIVSNSNYRRGNLANNRQQFHQNQSQSSLSKNSNLRSTNNANAQRGMANANRASAFNTFVPVSF